MSVKVKRKNPDAARGVYERLGKATKKEVAIGFPKERQNAYPDGTSVAYVAACHVYGIGVPRRDFMALAKGDILKNTKPILQAYKSDVSMDLILEAAGQQAEADVKKAIVDLDTPPNAPSTIALKGSDNPLIDTGHMVQATTHIVRDKTRK